MNTIKYYLLKVLLPLFLILCTFIHVYGQEESHLSERVKIALREIGNQLLLSNQDSTSLVLPIVELEPSKFQISFEKPLSIEPNVAVTIIKKNLASLSLSEAYIVEVLTCLDYEVAYSYEINEAEEKTLIPCASRVLPTDCYTIEIRFLNVEVHALTATKKYSWWLVWVILPLFLIVLLFFILKRKNAKASAHEVDAPLLGSFRFYPAQNKLVKEAIEIPLSKKECELLEIFVARPNEVIKRDELTKRVWEDNGVVVGRSLDTYISKLRKKLIEDKTIKLTNVHGVGYKLEITN